MAPETNPEAAEPAHVPVLLDRIVALFAPSIEHAESDGRLAILVDATLGLGGHAEALLRSYPRTRVIGIDRDVHALERSRARLQPYAERVTLVHAVYDEIGTVLADHGLSRVDGVLFDLGVSSMQLDMRERGFAYAQDAPLDMRMNDTTGVTAAEVLNSYSAVELARVLRVYGEERFAKRIADSIVRERERQPFTDSARLVELIRDAIPAPARRTGGHPAKRTFQALRIEVNDELQVLRRALPAAIDAIGVRGRVVVLSYHSLEDRITKQAFAAGLGTDVPPDLPFVPEGHQPLLRLVTRGAEKASAAEIQDNPRAASVRLRVAERVRDGAVA
ncbi:MAG: 16S rRNA (cytosine(1402)-N(4))-methyltransferase RsmH [Nocardioidaceae bacterium]